MSSVFVDDVSLLVDTFTEKSHQLWKLRLSIADGDSASSVSRQTAEDSDVSVFAGKQVSHSCQDDHFIFWLYY
jgi:hypothetical protein